MLFEQLYEDNSNAVFDVAGDRATEHFTAEHPIPEGNITESRLEMTLRCVVPKYLLALISKPIIVL